MTSPLTTSVTAVARECDVPPRMISDLFYARKLDDAKCPIVSGRRRIPVDYVDTIKRVVAEELAKKRGPATASEIKADLFADDAPT